MDVYEEAVAFLELYGIPVEEAVGADLLEDLLPEDTDCFPLSPLQTEGPGLPDTPTRLTAEHLLKRKLAILKDILDSEEIYLNELETLLTPMKALKASAGTSQPVLSSQQVQTVFYQVPELRDLHKDFYTSLRARLEPVMQLRQETQQDLGMELHPMDLHLTVGDLFLKVVNQLGVYHGFIENYESAVEIVRKCTQTDQRFRVLAESMKLCNGSDNTRTSYTFEALLYKPLDHVTKTTLALHDLLKHTPPDQEDSGFLQKALRISSSFLSEVNERSQCKRAVTVSRGEKRKPVRDDFVVDLSERGRSLRHVFLYTDLLLCVKLKGGPMNSRQPQYRFCWYMPLAGLRLQWVAEQERSAELQQRIAHMRAKLFQLRQELRPHVRGCKGHPPRAVDRVRRKMEECELWLLTHTPSITLELHSPSGESHTLLLSSLYELEEWREAMDRLKAEAIETVPPDLLTLTSSCLKMRMTQQPRLWCLQPASEESCLCGTLSVVVLSACGLQQPASLYVCVEVDGFEFFENQAQTLASICSRAPQWAEELSFSVDGAQQLRLVCVSRSDNRSEDEVIGRASLQLDPVSMLNGWRKVTLLAGQVEVTLSIKYLFHPLNDPSSASTQQQMVFGVPIGQVAQQEGMLVPHIVRSCAEEVERRGLEEVGIYRISGASRDIQTLHTAFNTSHREAVLRLRAMDINAVSGALKLYFRELPEPLIPTQFFQDLSKALDVSDMDFRLNLMLKLLESWPDVNRNTFLFLLRHLRRVAAQQDLNKMSLSNLATVFGPSLLRPPVAAVGECRPQMDISLEVEVQVQVVYCYLQCQNLPEALIGYPTDTEEEPDTDKSTLF